MDKPLKIPKVMLFGSGRVQVAKEYEAPRLTVLGDVTGYTQAKLRSVKPGICFDMQGSTSGADHGGPPATS